jgi:hypothetical protein
MATIQQLTLQRDKMQELQKFLESFQESMNDKIHYYRLRADELLYDGLPQETYNKLAHIHINETNHLVQKVVDFIEENTKPFVLANIENMEEQIRLNT